MDSPNISDFNLPNPGSRLLSESSFVPSTSSGSSRTGPGGDDLSLSELSLSNRPKPGPSHRRPFSLLAQPIHQEDGSNNDSAIADVDGKEEELGQTMTQEDIENAKRLATKTREEKLQHDLFMLKKLNAAFEVYKEALRETKSATERVASQLEHTNALLDKYVRILSKSEATAKLIMDERWHGAEEDEETLEREHREAEERARREAEERELAAQRERERLEREERERQERLEKERLERECAEVAKASGRGSGVRGVRGTRASMRGTRGATRAASTRGMGTTSNSSTSSIRTSRRTTPTTSTRTSGKTQGVPRRG